MWKNLFTFLGDIFLKEAENILGLSKIMKLQPAKLLQMFYQQPAKFAEELGKLGSQERKAFTEAVKKAQVATGQATDSASLSSSWLMHGVWEPNLTGDVGDLTITTKTGDSYTYPGVSIKVWEAMKLAKGSHGSGAGSVFWAMFLRGFKASPYGQLQAKVFKLAGIKSMSPLDVAKTAQGKVKTKVASAMKFRV